MRSLLGDTWPGLRDEQFFAFTLLKKNVSMGGKQRPIYLAWNIS